jgi:hypothetical protein
MLIPLGCDDKAVANMKKELGKCGVIVTGRGSTKKDKQRISISLSPAAKGVMEQTYFNPTWGISHHVCTHRSSLVEQDADANFYSWRVQQKLTNEVL